MSDLSKINSRAPLDRSPGKNWVENSGGLPMYIRRIANHLHQEKGMTIGHAIAVAVNVVKKMCATGDINFPGKQQVNPKSHAEACAAVASWERKKASARVSKGELGRKWSDEEFIIHLLGSAEGIHKGCDCTMEKKTSKRRIKKDPAVKVKKKEKPVKKSSLAITDEEFAELSKNLDTEFNPDDPDTVEFLAMIKNNWCLGGVQLQNAPMVLR
jgi:hypothetical protein